MEGETSGTELQTREAALEKGETGGDVVMQTEEALEKGGTSGGVIETLEAKNEKVSDKPSTKTPKPEKHLVPFMKLFSFADKSDYVLMIFGTIGALVHGAALPTLFLFFGHLLNGLGSLDAQYVRQQVNKDALNFVYIGLITLCSSWLEVSFWTHTGERQSAKLRAEYLRAILRQDISQFDADSKTGAIVTSITTDTLMVQEAIGEKCGNFLHHMSTFVVAFIIGFLSAWKIALETISVTPLIAISGGVMAYTYALTSSSTKASSAYSEAGTIAEQAISQVRTVYSFVTEAKIIKSYSNALKKTTKLAADQGLTKGIGLGGTHTISFLMYALLLWYGGKLVLNGTATGGAAISTTFAVLVGSTALGQAMPNVTAVSRARASGFKIFQVINQEPTINKPEESAETLETVDGLIELRDVEFSYPTRPDVSIFEKFSLVIPPGQTTALVGSSGSGKSTVISLIERFYDPNAGGILLDGHDLRTLNLNWLREQIGLVNQEPVLFATTIAENILYGNGNATKQEILDAASAASAHSFIEKLPLGYQTQVGDKGIQLSGGQKQRVAIARAILKNPKILLLDEATSALDSDSERLVQEALDRLMVGRTTVVVAHRLSTIRNADTIAVVQRGRIVESGTHRDLTSQQDSVYSALVRLQQMTGLTDSSTVNQTSRVRDFIANRTPSSQSYGPASRTSRSSSTTKLTGSLSESFSHQGSHPGPSSSFRYYKRHGAVHNPLGHDETDDAAAKPPNEVVKPSRGSVTRLAKMSTPYWRSALLGSIGAIGSGCLLPAYALILAEVLAIYYNPDRRHLKKEVDKYSLFMVGVALLAPVTYTIQYYNLAILGEKLATRVRELMFSAILRNELGWFDQVENHSTQITARLTSDAVVVKAAIGDRLSLILQNTSLLLLSISISFALSWRMALVMTGAFPLVFLCQVVEKSLLNGVTEDQSKAYARATQVAGEAASNIRTVAAFNAENKVRALYKSELEGIGRRSFVRGQIAGAGFGISQCILICTYGLGLWYAGKLVVTGQADFASVIRVFLVMIIAAFAAAQTVVMTPDIVKGGHAIDSTFEILDRETKIDPEDPEGFKVDIIRGDISLKRMVFAYPSRPDVTVLKNINLNVVSGHSLALVGASGSGKSSVIALIERFYDPVSGQVQIDGRDIKRYNLRLLRQHIALVQQDPALFATTIYENILYGKEGASEAEIIEAARTANAHGFTSSLPNGYQTQVGERGVQLSGGQKQRVAIARAVLKDPAILLLDEATSALDSESEKIVQEALDRLMKHRTTVMIAHRLSTIKRAHTIAVIQDGTVLEEGSHTELVALGGGYSRLINLQSGANES